LIILVALLSRLLEANVDVRFADFPEIEGATGKFMLHMLASVAEFEAGMISSRINSQAARRQAGRGPWSQAV
jgi:DNA invertase Pin-like site-specific DNA recombinase